MIPCPLGKGDQPSAPCPYQAQSAGDLKRHLLFDKNENNRSEVHSKHQIVAWIMKQHLYLKD